MAHDGGQSTNNSLLHLLLDAGDAVTLVQVALRLLRQLLVETVARGEELQRGVRFEQQSGNNDHHDAQLCMVIDLHLQFIFLQKYQRPSYDLLTYSVTAMPMRCRKALVKEL